MKAGVGSGTPHIFKYLDGASAPLVGSTLSAMVPLGCLGSAHRGCLRASRDRCFRERVRNAFVRARASCPPYTNRNTIVRREFAGRIVRGVPTPSRRVGARQFLMRHGEDVVNRCYLIIN